jgi:hypothetical protein
MLSERADPSASEATREPGSDALKCVPELGFFSFLDTS